MPRGWRSAGRSSGWLRSCANRDARRIPVDLAGALADRTPIDWRALAARLRDPRDRAVLDALRHLEARRGTARRRPEGAARGHELSPFIRFLLLTAAAQVVSAWVAASVEALDGRLPGASAPQLLLTVALSAAAACLAAASPREPRTVCLCAVFVLAAGAFARALVHGLAVSGLAAWLAAPAGVVPEAFAPALLWRFASAFPDVRRYTPFDVFTRRAGAAALTLGAVLFAANLALTVGLPGARAAAPLARDDPGNLFWHLFALASLPAVPAILARARGAPRSERRKAVWFAAAVGCGAAPLLSAGLVRMALPNVNDWMLSAEWPRRLWFDLPVLAGLGAMPVLATLAVVADGPPRLRAIVPAWARRRTGVLARGGWRSSARAVVWRAASAERLAAALDRLRYARGTRELAEMLGRELRFALGAQAVVMEGAGAPLAAGALRRILEDSRDAIDVSAGGPLLRLLPRSDREWLEERSAALAAPITRRDGSLAAIVLVRASRGNASFAARDRRYLSALLAAAAPMWESFEPAAGLESGASEPALECPSCGSIAEREPLACSCHASPVLAALPARLAGKFIVRRRLGAGGMGVVYVGRDTALGRDVALKTLPSLAGGRAGALRDEARAMAALNHESLATIYGLEWWRGTPILVVEYFPRGTLADRLARGPMPAADALDLGVRLARAIAYMHAAGVVHGDVKPANIGISGSGAPKLLDFGLAAHGAAAGGTPEYLPPEVLEGTPPGVASDLWGLAAVLREACGGAPIPPALSRFFERALAPDPAARFQSAAGVRDTLATLLRTARRERAGGG